MRVFLPVAAACFTAALAPPLWAQSKHYATVGSWDVSWYVATGGCLAFASFDGTGFFIGFDTKEEVPALDVTVLDDGWDRFEADEVYPVTVSFGEADPWTLDMQGVRMDGAPGLHILIDATMDQAEVFIEEFQHERRMRWSVGEDELGTFTLAGSRRAFQTVLECQDDMGHDTETVVTTPVAAD